MKILLVAATPEEMPAAFKNDRSPDNNAPFSVNYHNHNIIAIISGIGMIATAYNTGTNINNRHFDIAINIGIAGLLHGKGAIGDVFYINNEFLPELGCGENDNFITAFRPELINPEKQPFKNGYLQNNFNTSLFENINEIKPANGITVNRTQVVKADLLPDFILNLPVVETMEGAAFFYACLLQKTRFISLRSVSNLTSERDKSGWDIENAIKKLHYSLYKVLDAI